MYDLVSAQVLLLLVFGPMALLLGTMGLAALCFWVRRVLFGTHESVPNATLPQLLETMEHHDR